MDLTLLEVLKSVSLLYVEDDAATREELVITLTPWMRELTVAGDGQRGLELFRQKRPDLVLTDIQMPRVSGLAMSAEIRSLVPDQPIVAVSAYNDADYLFRAIELGIEHYMTKPVNVERLLFKLAHIGKTIMAKKELRQNQMALEQYKRLFDDLAMVCRIDLTGHIVYVNDRMCTVSGFAKAELIGRHYSALSSTNSCGEPDSMIMAQVKAGTKWTGMRFYQTKNNGMYVVKRNVAPLFNELGEVTEIISLDVDITNLYGQKLLDDLHSQEMSKQDQSHIPGESL